MFTPHAASESKFYCESEESQINSSVYRYISPLINKKCSPTQVCGLMLAYFRRRCSFHNSSIFSHHIIDDSKQKLSDDGNHQFHSYVVKEL